MAYHIIRGKCDLVYSRRESGFIGSDTQTDERTYKGSRFNRNDRTNLEDGLFNNRILIDPL